MFNWFPAAPFSFQGIQWAVVFESTGQVYHFCLYAKALDCFRELDSLLLDTLKNGHWMLLSFLGA